MTESARKIVEYLRSEILVWGGGIQRTADHHVKRNYIQSESELTED